jgi:hypothetical protein
MGCGSSSLETNTQDKGYAQEVRKDDFGHKIFHL